MLLLSKDFQIARLMKCRNNLDMLVHTTLRDKWKGVTMGEDFWGVRGRQ